jgi:hypothetical protein
MKTFKDLKFGPHPISQDGGSGLMARMNFENGYGVSVVRFTLGFGLPSAVAKLTSVLKGERAETYGSYTDNEKEWEVAILKGNKLCYKTSITSDVLGHLSSKQVSVIMKKVQKLK